MINAESEKMTVKKLINTIESRSVPVRRSTHVGNQPPRELAIMAGLPGGVDVLMVDTIQGSDPYTRPYQLIMNGSTQNLRSKSSSEGRVVGSLSAVDPNDLETKTLTEIHQQGLDRLVLSNRPVTMMRFFNQYPDTLSAVVEACSQTSQVTRSVDINGKISNSTDGVRSIFGAPDSHGLMLPLNGMMAMDMIISENMGSDSTIHLGGLDMIKYTKDAQRMAQVSEIFDTACAVLGLKSRTHRYRVVPAMTLATGIKANSQYELYATDETIDLSRIYDAELGEAIP